jgi:hypothetical protein
VDNPINRSDPSGKRIIPFWLTELFSVAGVYKHPGKIKGASYIFRINSEEEGLDGLHRETNKLIIYLEFHVFGYAK